LGSLPSASISWGGLHSAARYCGEDLWFRKAFPQRLKPCGFCFAYGTAEAVPLQELGLPQFKN
jgi:hypothetical protein